VEEGSARSAPDRLQFSHHYHRNLLKSQSFEQVMSLFVADAAFEKSAFDAGCP
jgi:hypothetical protein